MADRRLTEAQRREIAQDRAKGVPAQALAARFGVSRKTIERTVARGVQGEVKAEYLPEGLHWALTFPASFTVRT